MTLDEAVGRILRRHLVLLLVCMVVPVAGLLAVHDPTPQYQASARVQVPGGPASSTTQADAISNQATAIATTPSFVRQALAQAGVRRAPLVDYIKHNVSVVRQGESAVVDVTVLDRDPIVAGIVDRALASHLVQFINGSNQTSVPGALADIDNRLKVIRAQQTKLQTQLNTAPNDPRVPAWQAEMYLVAQEHADLNTERSQIVLQHALLPQALLLDAHEPEVLDSRLPQLIGLAVLLGLLLGLTAAAVAETFRPTVPTPRALSRLLDAPLLGRLRGRKVRQTEVERVALAAARAAHRARVTKVVVVTVPEADGLFAAELAGRMSNVALPSGSAPLAWTTADRVAGDSAAGMVLVAPYAVKRRAIEPVEDVRGSAGWPMLGIVTAPRRALKAHPRPGLVRRMMRSLRPAVPLAEPLDEEPSLDPVTGTSRHASGPVRRCVSVGLQVEIEPRIGWVGSMLDEALAGDLLPSDERGPVDLHVLVEREHASFDVAGWQVITRGVYASAGRVVMQDACSTGFDLMVEPSGSTLEVRARWCPSLRSRAAASLLRSRFHLLVRCALLQYPALWWAGVHGGVPLHVSAIRLGSPLEDTVVLLAGPGGVGKSTLLETELSAGGQATCDNVCVLTKRNPVDGVVASGLLEPLRVQGAGGRRMAHGRTERAWSGRASELTATRLVVVRRGRGSAAAVHPIDAEEAARALEGGTYAAGELRRYWPFAASLALGTGLGPVHPPVPEGALEAASLLPCSELVLPTWTGLRLADALATAEAPR